MREPILKVSQLTKIFTNKKGTQVKAVDQVSFEICPGECLGLIGESGSGKSTVANMITGFTPVTEGQIIFDGTDITHLKADQRRKVYRDLQMVFQQPEGSFDPRKTIGSGIGESLRNRGMSRPEIHSKVEAQMTACGLDPALAGRYPHELSGGQCQRAAIARAMIVEPKLLICDEVTSALDVTIQREIMLLLMELKKEQNLALLFICHDIALVRQFCDRVVVMYHGKIVESGCPEDVIRCPQNEYTKRLIEGRRLACLK